MSLVMQTNLLLIVKEDSTSFIYIYIERYIESRSVREYLFSLLINFIRKKNFNDDSFTSIESVTSYMSTCHLLITSNIYVHTTIDSSSLPNNDDHIKPLHAIFFFSSLLNILDVLHLKYRSNAACIYICMTKIF